MTPAQQAATQSNQTECQESRWSLTFPLQEIMGTIFLTPALHMHSQEYNMLRVQRSVDPHSPCLTILGKRWSKII